MPSVLAADFTANAGENLIRAGTVLAFALVAHWGVGQLVTRTVRRVVQRPGLDDGALARATTRSQTIGSVLTALGRAVVWTFATLLILGEFGFDIAPLIAGAGIIGLAVGFGAQGLVSDFVAGVFMLIEDQYGVGDWVDLGEAKGTVEHVGLRTTRVRSLDGLLWSVRNGEISRTANANQGWGRAVVDVGVGYAVDVREAQELIARAARDVHGSDEHGAKFQAEPEIWGVQDLGDDAVAIRLVARTEPGLQWGVARALRLRVKEVLDEAGVEIPFPQRTVWIRTEPDTLAAPIPVATANGRSDGTRA